MVDQALLEYLKTYLTEHRRMRFEQVLSQRTRHFTVATEDVYQLHNTSAVIRSCDVFGLQDIHVVEEINSKRIDREIAMGAQKWVDVHRYSSIKDFIKAVKSEGYQVVATTPHASGYDLKDFDFTKRSCFFFGRETDGLSDAVIEAADSYLKIPMVGFTESLNISVSAAIILQHVTSKLRDSEIDWKLTDEQRDEKWLDWIKKTIKSYDDIVNRFKTEQ